MAVKQIDSLADLQCRTPGPAHHCQHLGPDVQLRADQADALYLQVQHHRCLALAFGIDRRRKLGPGRWRDQKASQFNPQGHQRQERQQRHRGPGTQGPGTRGHLSGQNELGGGAQQGRTHQGGAHPTEPSSVSIDEGGPEGAP